MSPQLIIWPMIVVALSTIAIYFPMAKARIALVKNKKIKASVFRHNLSEPEESLKYSNPIRNQFETPVLFYVVCLAAYTTQNTSIAMIVLAFTYALAKIIHLYIHLTSNRLRLRMPVFAISLIILTLMWIILAVHMIGLF